MGEWQPIETAPKDGTRILVTDGDDCEVTHWYCYEQFSYQPYDRDGRDLYRRIKVGVDQGWGGELCGVTHWMPLPALPASADAAKDKE